MLHLIAFIIIGIVIGALFVREARGPAAAIRVVAGLIGSLIAGEVSLAILGEGHIRGKYGSVVIAVIVAVILSWLATKVSQPSRSRR
ncbi:MAG: GlsB/YeaQ/YmgE family stress response membrane protein [Candidatus Dormibacteria bacterium]